MTTSENANCETKMWNDDRVKTAVLEELAWEPSVGAAHIGVTAKDGVVTLLGHVETYAEKHAAETAARRVKGVKAVAEEIEVRLAFDNTRSDDEIAAAVVHRLAWNSVVPPGAVGVKVEHGWVTLDGQVDWRFQKDAARQDIRRLWGVTGVSDHIAIKPVVDTSKLSDDITHALHRSWFFDPAIKVTADRGDVRLSGSVKSPHDRLMAAATAWSAPGATSVQNDLRVT
jgi:osmotically-inducible protein OsmY